MFIRTYFFNFSPIHYYFIQTLFVSTLFTDSSGTFYHPIWIFLTFYHFLLLWNMQTGYSECDSSIVLGVLWLDWFFSDTKQLCKFFIYFLNKNICRSMYKFDIKNFHHDICVFTRCIFYTQYWHVHLNSLNISTV